MGQGKSLTTWKVHKEISWETMILQSKYNKKRDHGLKKTRGIIWRSLKRGKGEMMWLQFQKIK